MLNPKPIAKPMRHANNVPGFPARISHSLSIIKTYKKLALFSDFRDSPLDCDLRRGAWVHFALSAIAILPDVNPSSIYNNFNWFLSRLFTVTAMLSGVASDRLRPRMPQILSVHVSGKNSFNAYAAIFDQQINNISFRRFVGYAIYLELMRTLHS